jgi:hypothetical protein
MKTGLRIVIIAAVLLLASVSAEATSLTILFNQGEWIGTYDKATISYSALIGVCQNSKDCLYNSGSEQEDPASLTSTIGGRVLPARTVPLVISTTLLACAYGRREILQTRNQ